MNFKGMAIGDGFSDPVNMLHYGSYLYGIGLLDENERNYFEQEEEKARNFIQQKQWTKAFEVRKQTIF
jgi:vitellogenic carboxypeptidase-like protein